MMLVGRNWSLTGENYRFGFDGQEQDDEVYGNGNLNTAEFWEYDSRIGRRWNIDPIVDPSISAYSCFEGNPIKYFDWKGKSVDKDGLYATDGEGNFLYPDRIKEFELWASTDEGRKYILDHAQKGFTLKGEYIKDLEITATEDGYAHKAGVDVSFTVTEEPIVDGEGRPGNAYTSASLYGGKKTIGNGAQKYESRSTGSRLNITYVFASEYGTQVWDPGDEQTLMGVDVISHEVFLHGKIFEYRYYNDVNSFDFKTALPMHELNYVYGSLYFLNGWDIFNQAQLKLLGDKQIINSDMYRMMFNLGIGYKEPYKGKSFKEWKEFYKLSLKK